MKLGMFTQISSLIISWLSKKSLALSKYLKEMKNLLTMAKNSESLIENPSKVKFFNTSNLMMIFVKLHLNAIDA